ncbi:MAG: DNA repair exonuclease [Deltaproteobacteria bacterium]|nr:DNA repair exonuclease [Deltaproteobacteria bacterium]
MKFLHTADWQLGMKAVQVGGAGERVRTERLKTASRIVELAREQAVDFILLAGDTFEDNAVERVLIQQSADLLGGAGLPVYLIPGNHDPLVPGSVWEHPSWVSGTNVQILSEEKPVPVPGGLLYPCPVREKFSRKDPTAWIPAESAAAIRIGLAHGSCEGVGGDDLEMPIPRDAASRAGLDYLALGHWHSLAFFPDGSGVNRAAYPGTPEPSRFGERESGKVLIVEIEAPKSPPRITPLHVGGLIWEVQEAEIRKPGDLAGLRATIETRPRPEDTLLILRVTGFLEAGEQQELVRLKEIIDARFLYRDLDLSRLHPSPEDETWISALPPGVLQETAARVRQLADPGFGGTRPEGATPEIAAQALMELYLLSREVSA